MARAAPRTTPVIWTFRPDGYWDSPNAIIANIKGTWRRELVEEITCGGGGGPHVRFLAYELSPTDRKLADMCHPEMMGGEYLPEYRKGEVEIVDGTVMLFAGDPVKWRGLVIPYDADTFAYDWGHDSLADRDSASDPEFLDAHADAIRRGCDFATASSEFCPDLVKLYEVRIDLSVLTPE
jgi:hypothetical protein